MSGSKSPPNTDADAPNPNRCEECRENKWKYRCPGCGLVSCSLPCVKSHKQRTACTGKRPRTDFVPISKFDDKTLLSDYSLLEETKRVADLARRMKRSFGTNSVPGLIPQRLKMLRKAAYRRKTSLFFLPKGMSRNECNKSRFDQRSNCIYWTLEWRFHSIETSLIDHNVSENESLESIIEKHLSPTPWNDKFTPYRNLPLSDLRFFIQKQAKVSKSPYRELNVKLPINPQFRNILILEYPVIHVFLPTETPDFEIQEFKIPVPKETVISNPGFDAGNEGRVFKEEEIEEGEMESETRVLDLVEHNDGINMFSEGSMRKCMEPEVRREEDLDFDEEVKQAYSDLIGEMDPDDFLCFDSDNCNDENNKNDNNSSIAVGDLLSGGVKEELEDGEIPN
ncbi:hypothetical protein LUZ60_013465 [Juncus effusus]|nr:hypothetical protein LUZ60_013465 [Juncus effusus]